MLNLLITPKGPADEALAKAHNQHAKGDAATPAGKLRRTRFEFKIPGTSASMEIIRNEPGAKTKDATASYNCFLSPAEVLIGKRAFSGNVIHKATPLQLALFTAGLTAQLPTLTDSVLSSITPDDCALHSLTANVYFKYADETEPFDVFLDLFRHCKITLDSGEHMPSRKTTWKKMPPRVLSDPNRRHAFSVVLPFGRALVYLKRDRDEYPETIKRLNDADERMALCSATRCLLCFEIEVDLRRFWYSDSDGLTLQLPSDYRLWTHAKLPEDPVKLIWDAFRYETWLNSSLAVEESDADRTSLNWQLQEVLDAYFAGQYVIRHPHMRNDPKEFEKYRDALISKAHVDILNPWAINKLNLCKALGQQLTYENRFKPAEDPDFAPHTLSQDNVDDAIRTLEAAMKRKVG